MLKTVTSWQVLMMLAKALGEAKKSQDPARIEKAQKEHDAYRDLCLKSDEMTTGELE